MVDWSIEMENLSVAFIKSDILRRGIKVYQAHLSMQHGADLEQNYLAMKYLIKG